MMTMGLPPKYGKAPSPSPSETMLSGKKRGNPSSWPNVEGQGSSSTSGTMLMPPPLPPLPPRPPIHRRSSSESFADHLLKEPYLFNGLTPGASSSSTKTHDTQTTTTTININIDGKNKSILIDEEEDLGKKKMMYSSLPPLPPLDDDDECIKKKKKKVQINEEIGSSSAAAAAAAAASDIKNDDDDDDDDETEMDNTNTTTKNVDFTQYKWGRKFDPNMDPKKIKRILANRLSAQKSRLKKLEYKAELERTVDALQTEIGVLSPQVSHYDRQRFVLRMENAAMKQKMAHLVSDKLLKEAQFRALKEETEKLKQLYIVQQQNIKNNVQKEQQEKEQQQQQQSYNVVNQINMDFLNCLI